MPTGILLKLINHLSVFDRGITPRFFILERYYLITLTYNLKKFTEQLIIQTEKSYTPRNLLNVYEKVMRYCDNNAFCLRYLGNRTYSSESVYC